MEDYSEVNAIGMDETVLSSIISGVSSAYSEVNAIGMDETGKKGHNYITVVADLSRRKVIFVTDGKETLQKKHLKTARACAMRIELQKIYEQSIHRDEAEQRLKKLCSRMMHARLEPMKKFCATIRNHWSEILHYFEHPYTNAILEGMNSIIQNIKRRARGLRNDEYFKTMIYLGCGKLNLNIQIP